MTRKLSVFLLAAMMACMIVSASPSYAEDAASRVIKSGVLRCGYVVWPPYYQKDPKTGQLSGFSKDIVDEMMAVMGIKVEYTQEVVPGTQVQDLNARKYDAVCWDGLFMPQAAKFLDYSNPWYYMPVYAYAAKSLGLKNQSELNSEKIIFSGLDGDLSSETVQRLFPKAKLQSIPQTADPALIIENVITGKSHAVINDPISTYNFASYNPDKIVNLSKKPVAVYPMSFSVKAGDQNLINLLNKATDFYINTGRYLETLKKYDSAEKYFIPVERPDFKHKD